MRTEHTLHALPAFPVYSVGFTSDTRFLLGGGGGTGRSGVKNKIRLYEVDPPGVNLKLINESELEKDEDVPMTMAVHPGDGSVVCGVNASMESMGKGINENCRLYSITNDELKLERKAQTIHSDNMEIYQRVTAFSSDRTLIAVGSTDGKKDNEIVLLSYPSLTMVAAPFKIPSGELYGVDFSDSNLLITTTTTLYLISLPLNIVAKGKGGADGQEREVELPTLEVWKTIPIPSHSIISAGSTDDGSVLSFRSAKFDPKHPKSLFTIVNSAPPRQSGRSKIERKSFILRWDLGAGTIIGAAAAAVGKDSKGTVGEENWEVKKVRNLGKKAVTVFDVSANGKLVAYGASDYSVGILDARTFAPFLVILKSHDFPSTALQFNPSSSLLISASADGSIRLVVVPQNPGSSSSTLQILVILALLAVLAAVLAQGRL